MMSAEVAHGPTTVSPVQRSPWHSPVPYLFGGLAAMLGLIAFALLILACSYWKLSGYLDNGNAGDDGDIELGDSSEKPKLPPAEFEEKFLVIMAGQEKPTFLATPIASRASSFGSGAGGDVTGATDGGNREGAKDGGGDLVRTGSMQTSELPDQVPR